LPAHTDRVFVVDARHVLRGAVPLAVLIVRPPSTLIVSIVRTSTFHSSCCRTARGWSDADVSKPCSIMRRDRPVTSVDA